LSPEEQQPLFLALILFAIATSEAASPSSMIPGLRSVGSLQKNSQAIPEKRIDSTENPGGRKLDEAEIAHLTPEAPSWKRSD
jgi:hypothetical protein